MNFNKISKNDLFVFLLFLVIFYSIFRYVGTFNQGYNIVEDHFIISTHQSLESGSFSSAFKQMMRTELEGIQRFRPVFVFYILSTVKMFGVNLLQINVYLAFLCILTTFLLYKFCSNLNFSFLQSFLFALLTVLGPATVMWIRPTDAEIIGMLMLSFTLFFLSKSIYSQNKKLLYHSCFVFFLALTILSKESFMITVPAILFLYLIVYSSKNKIGIIQSFKENKVILILSFLILIFFLLYLISAVGINHNKGYSGVDVNLLSPKVTLDFINLMFKTSFFYVIVLGIIIVFIFQMKNFKSNIKNNKKSILSLIFVIFFMLLVIVPQFILYYKTGFFVGRYYLPYLMGFSFLLIYILKIISQSKSISSFIKYFYLTFIVVFLLFQIGTEAIPALTQHSDSCKETTQMLESITNNKDNTVLIVMDPVQNYYNVFSLKIILNYIDNQKDYKYDFIKTDYLSKMYTDTSFSNRVLFESKKSLGSNTIDSTKDNSDIKNILIFWSLDKKFVEKNKIWFNENSYIKKKIGNYTLYSK